MADIIIPEPDANGYWHFVYVTTDQDTGQWYGGKRSTKKHPLSDRYYLGSGRWIKAHPNRKRLRREIISFCASSVEVFAAEARLVTWDKVFDDPLCMNLRDGGEGVTVEAALLRYTDPVQRANSKAMLRRIQSDPKVLSKMKASAVRRFKDPKEHARAVAHIHRINSDPVLIAKARVTRETPEWRANVIAGILARATVFIETNGERVLLGEACRAAGVSYDTALTRRIKGWPESDWLLPPGAKRKSPVPRRTANRAPILVDLNGKQVCLKEACRQVGIPYPTAHARWLAGWSESKLLAPPRAKRTAR